MTQGRPVAVLVIGGLAVGFGALMVLTGAVFAVIGPPAWTETAATDPGAGQLAPVFTLMPYLFEYGRVMYLAQGLIGAVAIVAGLGFIQLKAWGRTILEAQAWLYLGWGIAVCVFACWALVAIGREANEVSGLPAAIPIAMIVFTVVGSLAGASPAAAVIWLLRGKTVRDAVAR